MCIICRMKNDCLCWLFLVAVYTIHEGLYATSDWTAFLWGYRTGLLHCTKYRVFLTIWQKKITWWYFLWFQDKTPNQNESDARKHWWHITCTYCDMIGMASSLTSHGSVNDITQYFSLNSFHVLSIDIKTSHLRCRWEILMANHCYGNLPFVSINVSFRQTVSLKTFPWIFPHPNFIKNTITLDYQLV